MVQKRSDSAHYRILIPWNLTEYKYYIFLCGLQGRMSEQEIDPTLLHRDDEEGNSYNSLQVFHHIDAISSTA